jgi:hypothetical protein
MDQTVAQNVGLSVIFAVVGGIVGIALVLASTLVIPKLIDRMTPTLDEEKEIARGNVAVAEYFGRVVAACILGISIVVAAAVMAGIMAALHG